MPSIPLPVILISTSKIKSHYIIPFKEIREGLEISKNKSRALAASKINTGFTTQLVRYYRIDLLMVKIIVGRKYFSKKSLSLISVAHA